MNQSQIKKLSQKSGKVNLIGEDSSQQKPILYLLISQQYRFTISKSEMRKMVGQFWLAGVGQF